ncbi:MAG: hypothetical protein WDW38_010112 [Sanguina aurantia]
MSHQQQHEHSHQQGQRHAGPPNSTKEKQQQQQRLLRQKKHVKQKAHTKHPQQQQSLQHQQQQQQLPDTCASLHPALTARAAKEAAPWKMQGVTEALMQDTRNYMRAQGMPVPYAYTRLLIENGTLFLTSLPPRLGSALADGRQYSGETLGMLLELYETSTRYQLPDMELVLYSGDEPNVGYGSDEKCKPWMIPLMSFARGEDRCSVVVPYSGVFRCGEDNFDHLLGLLPEADIPWDERKQIAFGRYNIFCAYWYNTGAARFPDGSPMPCARSFLRDLSKFGSDSLCGLTRTHRYLVNTDGWTASGKLERYLLLGSVVLNQASRRFGYYYDALEPFVNFVPYYVHNASDILQVQASLC